MVDLVASKVPSKDNHNKYKMLNLYLDCPIMNYLITFDKLYLIFRILIMYSHAMLVQRNKSFYIVQGYLNLIR